MRQVLLLLWSMVGFHIVHADSRFQKLYGDTANDDLTRIVKTSSGEYLLLGTVDLSNSGPTMADIALYRTNEFGDLYSSTLIGDTSVNVATDALENPDGTFTLSGYVNNRQQDMSSRDLFVMRIDDTGNILWENTYGISGVRDETWAMTRTTDGGVFLAGSTDDHALVCKLDEFGQVVWSLRVDSLPGLNQSYFNSITPTFDGGCVAAGWRAVGYDLQNNLIAQDLVARFSSSGQALWIRSVGVSGNNGWSRDITFTADGGFLLTGVHASGNTPLQPIYKLNGTGDVAWSLGFSSSSGNFAGSAVFTAADGRILAGGSSNQQGPYSASLLMTDSSGMFLHQWSYGMGSIQQITDAFDGDFVLCGRYDGSPFQSDGYLIKTNDTGYTGCTETPGNFSSVNLHYVSSSAGTVINCPLDQGFAVMTASTYINQFGQLCAWIGMEEPKKQPELDVFPNPASGTVRLKHPLGNPIHGSLLDARGAVALKFRLDGSGDDFLSVKSLPEGIYLVRGEEFSPFRLIVSGSN